MILLAYALFQSLHKVFIRSYECAGICYKVIEFCSASVALWFC